MTGEVDYCESIVDWTKTVCKILDPRVLAAKEVIHSRGGKGCGKGTWVRRSWRRVEGRKERSRLPWRDRVKIGTKVVMKDGCPGWWEEFVG